MGRIVVHWVVPAQTHGFGSRVACGREPTPCVSAVLRESNCEDCRAIGRSDAAVIAVLTREWAELQIEHEALLTATERLRSHPASRQQQRAHASRVRHHTVRIRDWRLHWIAAMPRRRRQHAQLPGVAT